MQAIQDTIETIAIGVNNLNTNSYRNNSSVVDLLLEDYKDLIDSSYRLWFAKRFYIIPFDLIHKAASSARQEANDPKRYFARYVGIYYNSALKKLASERALGRPAPLQK